MLDLLLFTCVLPVTGITVEVEVTFSNFLDPTISIDDQVSQFNIFFLQKIADVLNVNQ